jgi:hypothetical protein
MVTGAGQPVPVTQPFARGPPHFRTTPYLV